MTRWLVFIGGKPSDVAALVINGGSVALNLWLAPAVVAGALLGRVLVPPINQRVFEALALGLTALATVKLLVS